MYEGVSTMGVSNERYPKLFAIYLKGVKVARVTRVATTANASELSV